MNCTKSPIWTRFKTHVICLVPPDNDTDPAGLFAINSDSGVITVNGSLKDRAGDYVLAVRARDQGSPVMSNTTVVNITVTDVNLHPPVIGNLPPALNISIVEVFHLHSLIISFNCDVLLPYIIEMIKHFVFCFTTNVYI